MEYEGTKIRSLLWIFEVIEPELKNDIKFDNIDMGM
jgi:hypothetical protein